LAQSMALQKGNLSLLVAFGGGVALASSLSYILSRISSQTNSYENALSKQKEGVTAATTKMKPPKKLTHEEYELPRRSRDQSRVELDVKEGLVGTLASCISEKLGESADSIVVAVAGGTGSGKTTLTRAIYEGLKEDSVTYISHDNYYKDISHLSIEERAQTNFDHPDALDTDLLVEHLKDLKSGKIAQVPTYDFATHSRTGKTIEALPRKVILIEGILIFTHPELNQIADIKIFVDTEADVRLIRRVERDRVERGRSLESILDQYMTTVKPMHEQFVEPSKRTADIIVPFGLNSVALDMVLSHLHGVIRGEKQQQKRKA